MRRYPSVGEMTAELIAVYSRVLGIPFIYRYSVKQHEAFPFHTILVHAGFFFLPWGDDMKHKAMRWLVCVTSGRDVHLDSPILIDT